MPVYRKRDEISLSPRCALCPGFNSDFFGNKEIYTENNATDKLCDKLSGYGTLQCHYVNTKGSCPGAAGSHCWPNHIWTGEGGQYNLNSGGFGVTGGSTTHAFSVRCVLDLKQSKVKTTTAL